MPPTTLEDQIQRHRDHQHEHHRKWVAKRLVQLRHVVKVHAVDGPYEGWSEQDRGPGTDLLYLIVLGYARSGEVHAQDVLQQLAKALDPLDDPQRSVLHDVQVFCNSASTSWPSAPLIMRSRMAGSGSVHTKRRIA